MADALNYSSKAAAAFRHYAGNTVADEADRQGFLFLARLLERAEPFVLPGGGDLLDRGKPRPQVPGLMFRPPFPAVALEYAAAGRDDGHPYYEAVSCPKRIALAWEWNGIMPAGTSDAGGPTPGEGVVIASIVFSAAAGMWVPIPAAVLIPFDCAYAPSEPTPRKAALIASGRVSAKMASAPTVETRGILPLLPSAWDEMVRGLGLPGAIDTLSSDLMDEVNAYLDMCIALACTNVSAERIDQPPKLNRSRIKAGKAPLKDFHILKLAGALGAGSFGGTAGHGGPRSHLRRGHVRRLDSERVTWVNSCIVRGSSPGFVDKQYAVGAEG
jgi:hypothetical protein